MSSVFRLSFGKVKYGFGCTEIPIIYCAAALFIYFGALEVKCFDKQSIIILCCYKNLL